MRTLVVEDEPVMSDVLRRGLTRAGLAVDAVELGEDPLRPRRRDRLRRDRP
jgi:DNA-binding response OmpR family regulator